MSTKAQQVVVVHRGARDAYQVAHALAEAGLLEKLVTDLYWPSSPTWARLLSQVAPASLLRQASQRQSPGVPDRCVKQCAASGALAFALEKLSGVPFAWRRWATRSNDARLGSVAGRLATQRQAALLSYSYYGHSAFSHYQGTAPQMLFQLHPHPASVRRILAQELADHPECAASLGKEWEMALPDDDFERLTAETRMAQHWLVASTFTKETLVENGTPAGKIDVVPYGVDLDRFQPGAAAPSEAASRPLRLLFVGTINQRKGITYLLDALRPFPSQHVTLTVCGRVVDDLRLFQRFAGQVEVRPSVSARELQEAYQTHDLFVFPSVAEGFGLVLLEALASGLPILSTPRTAAPDLITEGEQGWVVEPRRADLLAERIEWALLHRRRLAAMRRAARQTAEQFTWARFRQGVTEAVQSVTRGAEDKRSAKVSGVAVGRCV